MLNSKLKLDFEIKTENIDICHILPSRRKDTHPIIIKFVRRSVRQAVYYYKKNLKSSSDHPEKLAITESLTKRRFALLSEARVAYGFTNVWTLYGNVFSSYENKRFGVVNLFSLPGS